MWVTKNKNGFGYRGRIWLLPTQSIFNYIKQQTMERKLNQPDNLDIRMLIDNSGDLIFQQDDIPIAVLKDNIPEFIKNLLALIHSNETK